MTKLIKLIYQWTKSIIEIIKQVTENSFDVFLAAKKDTRAEGILDDIQDLRRYLMLVEAEIIRGKEKNAEEPELFIEDRCEWKTG